MNDDELGVQILNANQMFVSGDDLASMFSDADDVGVQPQKEEGSSSTSDADKGGDNTSGVDDNVLNDTVVVKGGDIEGTDVTDSKKLDYKKSLLSLSRLGIIAEVDENSVFAGEDGEETRFSDLSIEDEESYLEYVKQLHEEKTKSLLENKADLNGVSDLTKKIIELDKAGGDVTSVLEAKAKAFDPIAQLDIDVPDNQKVIVAHYLSTRYADMSNDDIKDLVKSYEDRGVLSEKAVEYKASIEKAVNDLAEKQRQALEEQKKAFAEKYKGYKKSVKESVSTKFQLKDDYVKKLVDYGTKLDDRNSPELLNKKYEEMLRNPEDAADLILFLYDKEEYLKQKTNKIVSEERRNVFKKLTSRSSKSEASTSDIVKEEELDEERYIPLKGTVIMK